MPQYVRKTARLNGKKYEATGKTELEAMTKLAEKLAAADKTDYVIYEYEGKLYTDRLECWRKGGSLGRVRSLVCVP